MLKVNKETLNKLEGMYSGITEQIMGFENAVLPLCPDCKSDNTANVQVGVIDRTINIVGATTKIRLVANVPKPGDYFCNDCKNYF